MSHDLVWHANAIELIWMLVVGSGLILSVLNGLEALRDMQSIGGITNGRRTIAVGNLRREIVRTMIHAAWMLLGLLAASIPSSPSSTAGLVVQVVLVLAAIGMTINSYLDRRDRLYLLENGMQARDDKGRFTR